MRPVRIDCDAVSHAEGSCLITQGRTRVLVTASVEDKTPPFVEKGQGWITAEYGMLPRATHERTPREATRGRQSGRTLEIQRLIGRALRGVVDLRRIPDLTFTLDCDVLVADAGTRCASITGAYVALSIACASRIRAGAPREGPFTDAVAAVSVGIGSGEAGAKEVLLDLDYVEDSAALVDLNLVATATGRFVEIQGTAEREPFGESELTAMLAAGKRGLSELFAVQRAALMGRVPDEWLLRLPGSRL